MERLNKIRKALIYALIPAVFMLNYPSIGYRGESMNYEITVPILWLVIFFFVSAPFLVVRFKKIFLNKTVLFAAMLPIYATISLFWTKYFLRGFLSAGLLWLIFFAILSVIDYFKNAKDKTVFKKQLKKTFFITAFIACVICWLQCILDVCGVKNSFTALCVVCTYETFGFPHPNGLAIEPQYMGNLLIAPALIAAYQFFASKKDKKQKIHLLLLCIIYMSTLFLTLSRGAIFSFGIAFVLLAVLIAVRSKSFVDLLKSAGIAILSAIIAVLAQGTFAALSPLSIDFLSGVSTYINQLSLGKINLKELFQKEPENNIQTEEPRNEAYFDGYVEESTDIRKTLSAFSFDLWKNTPNNFIFGVGYGGAGVALNDAYINQEFSKELYEQYSQETAGILFSTPKQIVQNEYASILLELGIVGFMLAAIDVFVVIQIFRKDNKNMIVICLVSAYCISFVFMSGFTNVFHVYLLMPVYYYILPELELNKKTIPRQTK